MSPRIPIRLLATQSDQRLAALVREGHERAFEALGQRYRRPLLRYCRQMRLSDQRAEDVLQQALLRAWLALAGGAEVRDLKSWLYRIVHNAAVNAVRGASERPHSELTDALHARAVAVGESDLERHLAVRDALGEVAALPRMQRQAIFLTAVDGQSHDEVASALGISHGALRGLLYRARSTLRSAAAALTPPPLLAWASGGAGAGGPTADRLAELTAGAGGAGMAGLFLKGAVVAVTAGAVASGATVVRHYHGTRHPAGHAAAAGSASSSAGSADPGGPVAIAAVPSIDTAGGSKSAPTRPGRRHDGAATTRRQARRGHRGATGGRKPETVSGAGRRLTETHSSTRDLHMSDKEGGGSSGSSGSRDGAGAGGEGGEGGASAQPSSGGSSGDGSGPAATGSPAGGDGAGSSPSASDGGPGRAATSGRQTSGDQISTMTYDSTVKRDG
jgi:RNA polymerase sigma factor (sigma-70 family)